jgi:hypothetical protein
MGRRARSIWGITRGRFLPMGRLKAVCRRREGLDRGSGGLRRCVGRIVRHLIKRGIREGFGNVALLNADYSGADRFHQSSPGVKWLQASRAVLHSNTALAESRNLRQFLGPHSQVEA